MNADQCLEALTVCHDMAPGARQSARKVACDCIDEFLADAGSDLSERQTAVEQLVASFDARFASQEDTAHIRDYLGKIDRDLKEGARNPPTPTEED